MNLLTRRFPTIVGLMLLIAGTIAGWWYLQNNQPQIAQEVVPDKIKITNTADNKFTVSWITKQPTIGSLEYGVVGEKLATSAYDDRELGAGQAKYLTHHVTVNDLQPNTQYAFRILSGDKPTRFDNSGSPYSVTTGPTIAGTPPAKSLYGEIGSAAGPTGSTGDMIVYLALPGSAPASVLVTSSANYSFALSTLRTADLQQYIQYDPAATVANVVIENGMGETQVVVNTANAAPVPKILLGQNADYRTQQLPPVAQVGPESSPAGETPSVLNVEPLAGGAERSDEDSEVVLLNPEEEGEEVATTRPEFRGVGPENTVLSITVQSIKPYADSVVVGDDGTWSWTPPADLEPGEHMVTIAYIDEAGAQQSLVRKFFVSTALAAEGDPSFEATPSASFGASATPRTSASLAASPAASPRETIPSTESGVPVTGLLTPTLLTGALAIVIMVVGALMLAL